MSINLLRNNTKKIIYTCYKTAVEADFGNLKLQAKSEEKVAWFVYMYAWVCV